MYFVDSFLLKQTVVHLLIIRAKIVQYCKAKNHIIEQDNKVRFIDLFMEDINIAGFDFNSISGILDVSSYSHIRLSQNSPFLKVA